MKKQELKKHAGFKRKKLLVAAAFVFVALLAYYMVLDYTTSQKVKAIEDRLEPFATALQSSGLKDVKLDSDCAPDPNIKYGGPVLCGADVTYIFTSNDSRVLHNQFIKILETVEKQNTFVLDSDLSENLDKSQYSESTSSRFLLDGVEASCSLTLERVHVPPGDGKIDFRAGCSFKK